MYLVIMTLLLTLLAIPYVWQVNFAGFVELSVILQTKTIQIN